MRTFFKFSVHRFRSDRSGVTAIEFAMLAPLFFLIAIAILETGLIFLGKIGVDQATETGARLVRTNAVAEPGMNEDALRSSMCDRIVVPIECDNLLVDLRPKPDFDSFDLETPLRDGRLETGDFGYDPGDPGDLMQLRVFYAWPVVTDLMHRYLTNMDDGRFLMSAMTAFRREDSDTITTAPGAGSGTDGDSDTGGDEGSDPEPDPEPEPEPEPGAGGGNRCFYTWFGRVCW